MLSELNVVYQNFLYRFFEVVKNSRSLSTVFSKRLSIHLLLPSAVFFIISLYYYLVVDGRGFPDALIMSLGLLIFASQTNDGPGNGNWLQESLFFLAKLVLPIPVFGGLLSTAWPRIIAWGEANLLSRSNGHIVLLGVGERALAIVDAYEQEQQDANQKKLIVGIDLRPDSPAISKLQEKYGNRVVIITGDYTYEETLKSANVSSAGRIYVTGSNDMQNASAALGIEKLAGNVDTRLHLGITQSSISGAENMRVFDVRLSAARLALMVHPPFKSSATGFLVVPNNIVIVGIDLLSERFLIELATIWKNELDREKKLQSKSMVGYEWLMPIQTSPLPITVVGLHASTWFRAIQSEHDTLLSSEVLNVKTVDQDPRYIASSDINQLAPIEDVQIYFSIENEVDCVSTLKHLYAICNRGSIVCATWSRNPANIIANLLSADDKKPNVFVKSFSLMDMNPSHSVLDGSLWDRLARDLHERVYEQPAADYQQEYNLPAVIRYPFLLSTIGCHIVCPDESLRSNEVRLTSHNVNVISARNLGSHLAKLEHVRWCRDSLSNGKISGFENSDKTLPKTRMSLKPWENLTELDMTVKGKVATESTKDHCCEAEGFPGLMARLGLAIQPDESTNATTSGSLPNLVLPPVGSSTIFTSGNGTETTANNATG
jgi:voltage-gated potassium channel Kch